MTPTDPVIAPAHSPVCWLVRRKFTMQMCMSTRCSQSERCPIVCVPALKKTLRSLSRVFVCVIGNRFGWPHAQTRLHTRTRTPGGRYVVSNARGLRSVRCWRIVHFQLQRFLCRPRKTVSLGDPTRNRNFPVAPAELSRYLASPVLYLRNESRTYSRSRTRARTHTDRHNRVVSGFERVCLSQCRAESRCTRDEK